MDSKLKPGDLVLATKYLKGDPCDHFCVGFFAGYTNHSPRRCNVVDENGQLFRLDGFRRAEKITEAEGKKILALFPEFPTESGRSLWWHLERLRELASSSKESHW